MMDELTEQYEGLTPVQIPKGRDSRGSEPPKYRGNNKEVAKTSQRSQRQLYLWKNLNLNVKCKNHSKRNELKYPDVSVSIPDTSNPSRRLLDVRAFVCLSVWFCV